MPDLPPGHTVEAEARRNVRPLDALGLRHERLTHRIQGLRVWGSEAILHQTPTGTMAAAPTLDPAWDPGIRMPSSLEPTRPLPEAYRIIREDYGKLGENAQFISVERVLYPVSFTRNLGLGLNQALMNAARSPRLVTHHQLAYLIRVESGEGTAEVDHRDYLVDAHSGRILERIPLVHTTAAKGLGHSLYSGDVSLDTNATTTGFELLDMTRGSGGPYLHNQVVDLGLATDLLSTGTRFTSATDEWGDGQRYQAGASTRSANGQTAAVDAAYGLQSTWDYFANVHGRNGIDDLGTAVMARVHYATLYDNAFWYDGCFCMTYGDGNHWLPFISLDVAGHEMTHGITSHTAGLVYSDESGGLNEATSDIFGTLVEFYTRGGSGSTIGNTGGNWTLSEQCANPADPNYNHPLRYMYKPSKDGRSADAWSPSLGGLNVHYSSGPMNRCFYFLSQGAPSDAASEAYSAYLPQGMTGLGNDKAARIWYRALTTYLTPRATYLNARVAALRAARDLYGIDSPENIAVRKAFGAINVGDPNDTSDDLEAPVLSASVTGSSTLDLAVQATDNVGVIQVDYLVDQALVATTTQAPFSAQVDASRTLSNGIHTLTAKAYDAAGNLGTSAGVDFTLANSTQQLVVNPSFEAGSLGWSGDADEVIIPDYLTTLVPHTGHAFALFSGGRGATSQQISQVLNLPASASALRLEFWLYSFAASTSQLTDQFQVQVLSVPGPGQPQGLLATFGPWTNQVPRRDFVRQRFDLTAFKGQTIQLKFLAAPLTTSGSYFLMDDACVLAYGQSPVEVQVNPATLDLGSGAPAPQPLSATVTGASDTSVTWSLREGSAGGTLGPSGAYTAPIHEGFYHAVAQSVADPSARAEVSIKVSLGVSIDPSELTLPVGQSFDFTVHVQGGSGVSLVMQEGAAGGTIQLGVGGTGVRYFAPSTPGTYHMIAADLNNPSNRAVSTITVVTGLIALSPANKTLLTSATCAFGAQVSGLPNSVNWSVLEGAVGGWIDVNGHYTAPALPGRYHIVATSSQDSSVSATALVHVLDTDFNGDGKTSLDFFDLALLADGWSGPGVASLFTAGDLDGDGDVDDVDLALFLARFGGAP